MRSQAALVPLRVGSVWPTHGQLTETLSTLVGSRRHRSPRLKFSPARILALRTQRKGLGQRLYYGKLFRAAARMTNERLPIVTLQKLLRQQDLQHEPELAAAVQNIDSNVWKDRMTSLNSKGWTEEDTDHWVWILSGENADVQIERFASTDSLKPLFLILLLIQSSQVIREQRSLKLILDYVFKFYSATNPHSSAGSHNEEPKYDPRTGITPTIFLSILRRLTRQVVRIWPAAIVSLAVLTRKYIQDIPPGGVGYQSRCTVFNSALVLFGWPARSAPLRQMEVNWRAQKTLLAMSDSMDQPLIINKLSYRAIRKVMIGQKKSAAERTVATRYAKTWPPYRQDFDGHDVKRTPEDDQSRSVKAGLLMTEAGYQEEEYDAALGTLGGMTAESPTIQTRSLPPMEFKGKRQSDNFYSLWAMKVRSTRNAHEAWKAFNAFSDHEPPSLVYYEMIRKIQARGAEPSRALLPGDSPEAWPIHDANYSEYELSRLTPPSVKELYNYMMSRGIRPVGLCLQQLVSHAKSVEEGLGYLRDSGLKAESVSQLSLWKEPSYQALRDIPLLVFRSYIQLLCRLQPHREGQRILLEDELQPVRHAFKLTRLRLRPDSAEGATFHPAWTAIAKTLARRHVAVSSGSRIENETEALAMSLQVYRAAEQAIGLDSEMFISLCQALQKVADTHLHLHHRASTIPRVPSLPEETESLLGSLIHQTQATLAKSFGKLTTVISQAPGAMEMPKFGHSIIPVQLHAYMRTLFYLDDLPGMLSLLSWILENMAYVTEEADRKGNSGHTMIARTLCAFEALARPRLDADQQEVLDRHIAQASRRDPTWNWPTPEEVEAYSSSDARAQARILQLKAFASSENKATERRERKNEE